MGDDKKRKRQEQGGDRPSKKTAIAPAQGNVKVEYIDNDEVLGPIIASTPGLKFPSPITFKTYKRTKLLPGGSHTELLLQSSEHSRLDYTAREEKDGSSESKLKDYIGVYDPTTSKMQLMPVKRVTVRSSLRSETEELQNRQARIEAAQSTFTAKRHALAAEFGSKRSRKAIEDMTQNAIQRGDATKDEGIAENVLQGMSGATAAMPTSEELAAAVAESKPRPRANLAAEYPIDVYPIDVVVGKEFMALIEVSDWVSASESGAGVEVRSRFVAKRISKLVKNKQYQKLKLLRFILLCVKLNDIAKPGKGTKKLPPKGKFETAMGEDVPAALGNTIRRRFASETNDLPRWNIDNMITHACAAALIVDDFETDVNDLREDFKIENKQIRQYFSELGCRLNVPTEADRNKLKITKAESNSHTIAKLRLPLKFPQLRRGAPGRR
ncbi:DNA-directed RNA polymerase I subunit rpa49 [Didymosphaeria variabile]|uniref:DNA-directed RNA polymerase I subunit rpa49 n=1 Tax=Didymosphaeria variabile TaxID=1932322 RepID=A0A9W8XLX9_9PLEO|nr:DNA-directed RNA polymerase I subunit rpa49 [Didymosphaeria variabile]KAJ4353864.1 DNA-directed RNA polymerase I subunit rpa49 [Didymosphaeria variabile]